MFLSPFSEKDENAPAEEVGSSAQPLRGDIPQGLNNFSRRRRMWRMGLSFTLPLKPDSCIIIRIWREIPFI